ncbi:MAG: signal peptidase II [Nitrosomonadaceae bacterium]|nr:signal peptidase II [Nitrosomonadaceae bacterium]|tara:strand:- start:848 stop:1315 length:468 start_codon:yes stop_codon:yes gene_type:complete
MKFSTSLVLAIIILILDFSTKRWVESELIYGEQIFLTNFFNLVLVFNTGAAFSFLSNESGWQRWLFSGVAICAAIVITYLLKKHTSEKLFCISLSFILGGALGNLWDRLALGYVVDFIDIHYSVYHWPAFNVADSAIFIGALCLIIESFKHKENK